MPVGACASRQRPAVAARQTCAASGRSAVGGAGRLFFGRQRRTQRQLAPDHAPGRQQLLARKGQRHAVVQAFAALAGAPRLGQMGDAGVRQAQQGAAALVRAALQQAGGQQVDLHPVLARPAGRAPDFEQTGAVVTGEDGS